MRKKVAEFVNLFFDLKLLSMRLTFPFFIPPSAPFHLLHLIIDCLCMQMNATQRGIYLVSIGNFSNGKTCSWKIEVEEKVVVRARGRDDSNVQKLYLISCRLSCRRKSILFGGFRQIYVEVDWFQRIH